MRIKDNDLRLGNLPRMKIEGAADLSFVLRLGSLAV